jgi:hypothetical protein
MTKDKFINTKNVKVSEKAWLELIMMKYNMGIGTVGEVVEELLKANGHEVGKRK